MRKTLLATTMLAWAGAAGAQTCVVPGPAVAAGYTQQTFGAPLTVGTVSDPTTSYPQFTGGANLVPFDFFGTSWTGIGQAGSNGSVTLNGAGEAYGDGLATASVTPTNQTLNGVAFGGGAYFQVTMSGNGPMSFWMNDAETMNTASEGGNDPNPSGMEVDIAEFDTTAVYGAALHNWYNTGSGYSSSGSDSGPLIGTINPQNANYSQPNNYGFLWVPATATTQGSAEFFFNGQQVGNTITWKQYVPGQSAPDNPFAVMDSLHMIPILGAGGGSTVSFSNLQVWQASDANNIGTQAAVAAAAAPCGSGASSTPSPATAAAPTAVPVSYSPAPTTPAPTPTPIAPEPAAIPPAATKDTTPGNGSVTDCSGNVWTVNSANRIEENGALVVGGGDTSKIVMQGCTVMGLSNGENGSSTNWFTMNSANPTSMDRWTVSSAPISAPLSAPVAVPTIGPAAPLTKPLVVTAPSTETSACPVGAAASGGFHVAGGQIIGPDGQAWVSRGVNLYGPMAASTNNGSLISQTFPGVNFIRYIVRTLDAPSSYDAFVNNETAKGIVVEFEHHPDGGGGQDTAPPEGVAAESAWYSSMASHFGANPYVWFGTFNEPGVGAPGQLSAWHQATYSAIRSTGNNNPILIEPGGSRPWNLVDALVPSVYAGMTNIVMDPHVYGYQNDYSSDPTSIANNITGMIAAAQTIKTADGTIPVIIGESGPSTTGSGLDPNGDATVQGLITIASGGSMSGLAQFTWYPGFESPNNMTDPAGNLTIPYGQEAALYINTSITPPTKCQLDASAQQAIASVTAAMQSQ